MLDLSSYLELELALTFLMGMIDDIQIWSQSCVFFFNLLFFVVVVKNTKYFNTHTYEKRREGLKEIDSSVLCRNGIEITLEHSTCE